VVEVAGTVASDDEKRGIEILIEEVPCVTAVRDLVVVDAAQRPPAT